jgi:CheY-like chemotaxis protein
MPDNKVIKKAIAEGTQRRRARLQGILERAPSQDEAVKRACKLLEDDNANYTLVALAREMNERYGYEFTDDALRKRLERAGTPVRILKTGQNNFDSCPLIVAYCVV